MVTIDSFYWLSRPFLTFDSLNEPETRIVDLGLDSWQKQYLVISRVTIDLKQQ